MCPYARCKDCCIVHSNGALADPELVGGCGWSCMVLLHPAPTCAHAGPDLCTLYPDLCTLHPGLCILCLRWLSPTATYGSGVFRSAGGAHTPLAHVMVTPIATCAGGVFPSTHWRRFRTCTRSTCTVWWWLYGVVVVMVVMWWWWWCGGSGCLWR